MNVFKKPKFAPRPANYIPGVGRGAVPFFTRSDIGAADHSLNPTRGTRGHEHDLEDTSVSQFDKWMGFDDKPFKATADPEDMEADKTYDMIQRYMEERRKNSGERVDKHPVKKREVSAGAILAEMKPALATVTYDQWNNLPEAKSVVKKKVKKLNYLPTNDRVVISAFNDSSYGSTVATMNPREALLTCSIDKAQVGSFTSVNPEGYLTHLDTLDSSNQEVHDLKKLKALLKSLIATNPNQPQSWLTASRLEEKDGNVKAALELLRKACEACPHSEDLWLELARLESTEASKKALQKAADILPTSIKIWLALAAKGPDSTKVLKKALDINPESVKLWKELIGACEEKAAKKYLEKAVICAPHSLELWLALAKLEPYKEARKTLNNARKQLPCEPAVWISAAKLEEAQGNLSNVNELIKRGIKTLVAAGVEINRDIWMGEAIISERAESVLTAKAILRNILTIGVKEDNSENVWLTDFNKLWKERCIEISRYFYQIALEARPHNKKLWKNAYYFEKEQEELDRVGEVLAQACRKSPDSGKLWVLNLENARSDDVYSIFQLGLQHNSSKTKFFLTSFSLLSKTSPSLAELVLKSGLDHCYSVTLVKKLIQFHIFSGNHTSAQELLTKALSDFPSSPSLYCLVPFLSPAEECKQILSSVCIPLNSGKVWVALSQAEMACGSTLKARYVLERARSICSDVIVHIQSIEFELGQNNRKAAELLLSHALQKFDRDGKLWALWVRISERREKKRIIADALEKRIDQADLLMEIGRMFQAERKFEKARGWYEKVLAKCGDVGDFWALYYEMEMKAGEQGRAAALLERVKNAKIRKGRLWKGVVGVGRAVENEWALMQVVSKLG